jgi:hypothetical protein
MSSATIGADALGQFSETMWFKKGDADVSADGDELPAELPLEERYLDDGTLTADDNRRYGLRTGTTVRMRAVDAAPSPRAAVSERELVHEMMAPRAWIAGAVVLATIGVIASAAPLLQLLH